MSASQPRTAEAGPTTAPSVAAVVRVLVLVVALLGAGGALYAVFVEDVYDRGHRIVDISVKSKEGRETMQLGASACALLAASGLASFARPVRGRRLAPLAGLGLGLLPAALVGLTAFSLGRTAFKLALAVAAPAVLALVVACLTPPRPRPGLVRFLLRSWMANGFLLGLVLLGLFGIELAEQAKPRVPWASVFAAFALGTLLQLAARYVGMHGGHPTAFAKPHEQVRTVHEGEAIAAIAERLHPYIDEGRAAASYQGLATDLGATRKLGAPQVGDPPHGLGALAPGIAAVVAVLRAAGLALPVAVLAPFLGWPAAVVAFGLVLPVARKSLNPRQDPTPRGWWLAGAVAMAAGGAWLGSHLTIPGVVDRLTWPLAGALALPNLALLGASFARPAPPGHLAFLRLEHARRLDRNWRRTVLRGATVAFAAVTLPAVLALARAATSLGIRAPPWDVLLAVAAAGLLWAAGGLLLGPAARSHRDRLGQVHAANVAARSAAHRRYLDHLETL